MRLVRGFVKISRLEHGVLTALTVDSAYLLAGGKNPLVLATLALSSLFAEVFLFVTNDIHNLEEDSINRPDAPLVTGLVKVGEAWVIAYASLAISLIQVLPVALGYAQPLSLVILALALTLGYAYNVGLKRRLIVNNVSVALVSSLTYLYGLFSAENPPGGALRFLTALFLVTMVASLGREVGKGSIDVDGDLKVGIRTIASTYGVGASNKVSSALILAAVALSPLIMLYSIDYSPMPGIVFSSFVAVTDAIMVALSVRLLKGSLKGFRGLSLAAMGLTLLGFLIYAVLATFA